MQLVDWLNDLTVRFLINLPPSELTSVSRICFQIEEAQWYYEDFVRPLEAASGNHLPHLPLKDFCLLMFKTCPLTSGFTEAQHVAAYDTFLAYKTRIPVRGAIMLDPSMERAVLVKGWKKGASWSFPRGKINKDEKDLHCAVREVYEETGYDIKAAGLVPMNEDDAKYIDVNIREQQVRLFVFSGVPLDTHFEPRTRKEISGIQWYNLKDLPGFSKPKKGTDAETVAHHSRFYMVAPFIGPLKKWIGQQRRIQAAAAQTGYETSALTDDAAVVESMNETRTQELRHLLNIGGMPMQAPVQPEVREIPREQYLAHGQHMQQTLLAHDPRQYQGIPPQYNVPPQQLFPQHQFAPPQLQGMQLWPEQARSPPQHVALPPVQNMLLQQFNNPTLSQQGLQHQSARHNGMQHHLGGQQSMPPHEEPREQRAAPKASELPAPKLNAHAMRLLETFKTSSNVQDKSKVNSAEASTHQTRLLDLFKSPTPAAAKTSPAPPAIPIESKPVSVQPAQSQPPPVPQTKPGVAIKSSTPPLTSNVPPSAKPAAQPRPTKEPKQKEQPKTPIPSSEYGFMQEMQALTARKPGTQSQPRQNSQSPANTVRRHKPKNSQDTAKIPTFTILPRPGSAKEDTADFKPQILKRPSQDLSASPVTPVNANTPQQDHLLALFGKGRTASSSAPPVQVIEPPSLKPSPVQPGQNVTILQNKAPAQTTPIAPQAPRIVPEMRAQPPTAAQSNLLDLFKKPGLVTSPETPISPFALGSPQAVQHAPLRGLASSPLDKRPELLAERKGSSSATPTEAKGFLLGFLNNVVQKEGRST